MAPGLSAAVGCECLQLGTDTATACAWLDAERFHKAFSQVCSIMNDRASAGVSTDFLDDEPEEADTALLIEGGHDVGLLGMLDLFDEVAILVQHIRSEPKHVAEPGLGCCHLDDIEVVLTDVHGSR